MMNLKDLNKNSSGFMLTEVLMAIAIVGLLIVPITGLISNVLLFSARYRNRKDRLIVMKNLMLERIYKSKEEKKQKAVFDKKIKDPSGMLRYTRENIKRAKPFDKIAKKELQNLCLQKVIGSFDKQTDYFVSFLYKPKL